MPADRRRASSADPARPLRVLVDDSAAFDQGAGIGRYARNVVPAAAACLPDAVFTLVHATAGAGPAPYAEVALTAFAPGGEVRVRRVPIGRRRLDQLWYRLRVPMPVQVFGGRADVVYSPDFAVPPAGRTPRLPTIHDLAYLVCPERVPPRLRDYLAAVVPRQVADAARVLAVSETTRRDLVERLGVAEERIAIVPNGVDERFFAAGPLSVDERQTLGVPAAYLLSVGSVEPRKDHETLFAAVRRLGPDTPPVVVAGSHGWNAEAILDGAAGLIAAGRVVVVGRVAEEMLPGLYAGAEAVVYPSWYEGFGLPVVEALAAGVPTVASTAPALREVAGDAALFAPPGDPAALAEMIEAALGSAQRTEAAREARRRRARCFSWARAGAALADVIREVGGR